MLYVSAAMSKEHTRDRGNLFESTDKKKPSAPDFTGDCTIDGTPYEIRGWRREDQLTISLAPPRGDRNTYPPDVFKGSLEAAPPAKPVRGGGRGQKDAAPAPPTPAWTGDIVSDEAAYTIRAFEKQGKSGLYYTLNFEKIDRPAQPKPDYEYVDPAEEQDA
jgi:hypothetical protein